MSLVNAKNNICFLLANHKEWDMKTARMIGGSFGAFFLGIGLPIIAYVCRDAGCADGSKNSDWIFYYPFMISLGLICIVTAIISLTVAHSNVRIMIDYHSLSIKAFLERSYSYNDLELVRLYKKLVQKGSPYIVDIENILIEKKLLDKKDIGTDNNIFILSDAYTNINVIDISRKVFLTSCYIYVDPDNQTLSDIVIKLSNIESIQIRKLLYLTPNIGIKRKKAIRIFYRKSRWLRKIDIFPENLNEWSNELSRRGFIVKEMLS